MPVIPPIPVELPRSVTQINRQVLVEENGSRRLRDGGPRGVATNVVEVRRTYVVDPPAELGEPDFPAGIDYERWTSVVTPAPRDVFADRLDVVDLFDD
jgi:hypothetical protein